MNKKIRVLFVCLGNICRSPMAEGTFRQLITDRNLDHLIEIDSAGTGNWHVGSKPDHRAMSAARQRGIDISGQRARTVTIHDFQDFDYILAMDADNYQNLLHMAPEHLHHKIHLYLDFAPNAPQSEVPDPYFGGADGFKDVLDLVEEAAQGLLAHIQEQHQLS